VSGQPVSPASTPPKRGDALGLSVASLSARARVDMRVPSDRAGVVIRDVLGADPGADALEEGDVVVEVNRKPTPDLASYRRVLESLRPGEPAWVYVYRPRPRGSFLTRLEVGEVKR
jgi:S1-C subfamily serine protease